MLLLWALLTDHLCNIEEQQINQNKMPQQNAPWFNLPLNSCQHWIKSIRQSISQWNSKTTANDPFLGMAVIPTWNQTIQGSCCITKATCWCEVWKFSAKGNVTYTRRSKLSLNSQFFHHEYELDFCSTTLYYTIRRFIGMKVTESACSQERDVPVRIAPPNQRMR